MRFFLLLSLLALGGGTAAVAETQTREPESTAMFVTVVTPAKFIGFPSTCPGDGGTLDITPEEEAQMICMAELYEAKVRVEKRISGPKVPRTLTVRFTAHSFHAVWQPNMLFLLEVVPFEDEGTKGHFAYRWNWEDENRDICLDEASLVDEPDPIRQYFVKNGRKRTTGENDRDWSGNIHLRCIH